MRFLCHFLKYQACSSSSVVIPVKMLVTSGKESLCAYAYVYIKTDDINLLRIILDF